MCQQLSQHFGQNVPEGAGAIPGCGSSQPCSREAEQGRLRQLLGRAEPLGAAGSRRLALTCPCEQGDVVGLRHPALRCAVLLVWCWWLG